MKMFLKKGDNILQKYQFDVLKFEAWNKDAVLAMDQWVLSQWQASEKGSWVCKHAVNISRVTYQDSASDETSISISGYLSPKRWTEYCLKFRSK